MLSAPQFGSSPARYTSRPEASRRDLFLSLQNRGHKMDSRSQPESLIRLQSRFPGLKMFARRMHPEFFQIPRDPQPYSYHWWRESAALMRSNLDLQIWEYPQSPQSVHALRGASFLIDHPADPQHTEIHPAPDGLPHHQ